MRAGQGQEPLHPCAFEAFLTGLPDDFRRHDVGREVVYVPMPGLIGPKVTRDPGAQPARPVGAPHIDVHARRKFTRPERSDNRPQRFRRSHHKRICAGGGGQFIADGDAPARAR